MEKKPKPHHMKTSPMPPRADDGTRFVLNSEADKILAFIRKHGEDAWRYSRLDAEGMHMLVEKDELVSESYLEVHKTAEGRREVSRVEIQRAVDRIAYRFKRHWRAA